LSEEIAKIEAAWEASGLRALRREADDLDSWVERMFDQILETVATTAEGVMRSCGSPETPASPRRTSLTSSSPGSSGSPNRTDRCGGLFWPGHFRDTAFRRIV
jgi:hypothetical protein